MMHYLGINPEMLENLSKMMSKNKSNTQNSNTKTNTNFDLNNIDINMLMKLTSNINSSNKDDPRNALLNALKPYMRDNKKEKIDNYINMINVAKIANILNKDENLKTYKNKENK